MAVKYGIAVRVRFLGPTDHKPARFSAQVLDGGMMNKNGKPLVESFNYGSTPSEQAHDLAKRLVLATFPYATDKDDAIAYSDVSVTDYVFIF